MNSQRLSINIPRIDPYYENFLKTALTIQPKLIITGTLGLRLCGLFEGREIGDLDFNVASPLTEDEVLIFKDFFDLTPTQGDYGILVEEKETIAEVWTPKKALENPLCIQFFKFLSDKRHKIDIFHNSKLDDSEIILIDLKFSDGTIIPCNITYPPYIISYKARLAFDPSKNNHQKHYFDIIKHVMGDSNYQSQVSRMFKYSLKNYKNKATPFDIEKRIFDDPF
jgi:hypothetical protein